MTVLSLLRGLLDDAKQPRAHQLIVTRNPGYLLRVGPEQLDVLRFDALMHSAGEHLTAGRNADASTTLRAALALWRGQALTDVPAPFAEVETKPLADVRLAATVKVPSGLATTCCRSVRSAVASTGRPDATAAAPAPDSPSSATVAGAASASGATRATAPPTSAAVNTLASNTGAAGRPARLGHNMGTAGIRSPFRRGQVPASIPWCTTVALLSRHHGALTGLSRRSRCGVIAAALPHRSATGGGVTPRAGSGVDCPGPDHRRSWPGVRKP